MGCTQQQFVAYGGDLNSQVSRSWGFAIQLPGTMEVQYSDDHLVNEPVFRPPFE